MRTTYTIDLQKDKHLYYYSNNDLPEDVQGGTPTKSGGTKGSTFVEEKSVDLLLNGGFLLLPSSYLIQQETEDFLEKTEHRQQVLQQILTDNAPVGLLGLINFKKEDLNKISTLQIEASTALVTNEEYQEETLTIDFQDHIDSNAEDFNVDINIFDYDNTKTKSLSTTSSSIPTAHQDLITEAAFYDDQGKEIYRQYLLPKTIHEVANSSVQINLNNRKIGLSNLINKKKKRPLLKRIKLFIRKFVGKVRRVLKAVKDQSIKYVIEALAATVHVVKNPYKILKYNFENKKFTKCKVTDIDINKKTLLLLHGTAKGSFNGLLRGKKNTKGSFKYLYNKKFKGNDHWFEYLVKQTNRPIKYEQIITFEHETLLHNPQQNVEKFIKKLKLDELKFQQPIAVIAASRGSLLAKYLSSSPLHAHLPIDRVAIISGGYSDYMDDARGIEALVNMMMTYTPFNPATKFILTLSLDVISQLPGLEVQNKNSPHFKELIRKNNEVYYFNIINNFLPQKGLGKMFKSIAHVFLGPENDLALSLAAQQDYRPGKVHPSAPPLKGMKSHGKGVEDEGFKDALFNFLTADLQTPIA